MNLTEADTPLCNALESNALDSFDLRAWKSLAKRLERDLAQIRAQGQEPRAYGVVNDQGYWAGCWNRREDAEAVKAKGQPSHKEVVIPLYAAPPVPQGMVLVPVEPSDMQCVNGAAIVQDWLRDREYNDLALSARIYRAMLSAAQSKGGANG